jgi:hypothetical protein
MSDISRGRVSRDYYPTAFRTSADISRFIVVEDASVRLPLMKRISVAFFISRRINPAPCVLHSTATVWVIAREKSLECNGY